jgi:hypothetical protein
MWRGHSWISCVRLPQQRSLGDRGLYFRFIRVFVLSRFCGGVPKYLSRRFAEHFHHAVFRNLLRRMFEKNEAPLFAACNHGAVGQPAWRLFARSYYCWCFFAAWRC